MSRILVTGGAGFIGSHLCNVLSVENEVVSLDNYFTGSKTNHMPGVKYIAGSTHYFDLHELGNFDLIYHLGEYSRVEQSFKDADFVWNFNKLGTKKVLDYAKDTRAKLIYAGSSTKFAQQDDGYIQSPYAWSKASNTDLVNLYGKWYGLDYAITYFYNVYGPRETSMEGYTTLIELFRKKMLAGEPLTVVLPGTQIRNFTHVDDTIDALLKIGRFGKGDEYGIGSPEHFSVLDVANMFGGEIEMLSSRLGNRFVADVKTDNVRALGWEAFQSLPQYIEHLRANNWAPLQ